MKEGFVLIDKPKGITSFAVIKILRSVTGIKKIGHCGTLDPNASGVLVCAIGRSATRKIDYLLKKDKTYLAELKLGEISDTYDEEGKIEKVRIVREPTLKKIKQVLKFFIGEQDQTPPIYSAKKICGKKAYELARQGLKFKLKPNKIKINKIKLVSYQFPILKIEIDCGSGTYIRSLAQDIGDKLETGAYLKNLRRTKVGAYHIRSALDLAKLNRENWEKYLFQIKNIF